MKNKDDFIGKRFGRLVVLEKAEPYISPKGYRKTRYLCQCDCGNKKIITKNALVSHNTVSCGCWNNEKRHKPSSQRRDLVGQRFGKLTVIERGPNIVVKSNEQKSTWICKCDCGTITRVRQNNLLKGTTRSCGCLIAETQSRVHLIDLTGKKFGKLTVVERAGSVYRHGKPVSPLWMCLCDCGRYKKVQSSKLTSGDVKSCGCMVSVGEFNIQEFLDRNKIEYLQQYTFDDLTGPNGGLLRFDFVIYKDNSPAFLLEYQGEQHYDFSSFGKIAREYSDPKKKEYRKTHDIKLYEITYLDNIEDKLTEILKQENILCNI